MRELSGLSGTNSSSRGPAQIFLQLSKGASRDLGVGSSAKLGQRTMTKTQQQFLEQQQIGDEGRKDEEKVDRSSKTAF